MSFEYYVTDYPIRKIYHYYNDENMDIKSILYGYNFLLTDVQHLHTHTRIPPLHVFLRATFYIHRQGQPFFQNNWQIAQIHPDSTVCVYSIVYTDWSIIIVCILYELWLLLNFTYAAKPV